MQLHVELQKWEEAFILAKSNPKLAHLIYLPYAEFLAINDRFDEAQEYFKMAGKPDISLRMVERLSSNAVTEHRFQDAAYYYWLLALENLKLVQDARQPSYKEAEYLSQYEEFLTIAEIYFAYNLVHKYIEEPF